MKTNLLFCIFSLIFFDNFQFVLSGVLILNTYSASKPSGDFFQEKITGDTLRLSNGGGLVIWVRSHTDLQKSGVYGKIIQNDGTIPGPEIFFFQNYFNVSVSNYTAVGTSVISLPDGNFMINAYDYQALNYVATKWRNDGILISFNKY